MYDSVQRAEGVPKFYRSNSCLTYNGTAVTGPVAIKELLERLPITKHEVQSYDCHTIPSECITVVSYTNPIYAPFSLATSPPGLLINVSGLVTHGQPSAGGGSAGGGGSGETKTVPSSRNVDTQPRVFSQTFILMKMEKYYISADSFRFVG